MSKYDCATGILSLFQQKTYFLQMEKLAFLIYLQNSCWTIGVSDNNKCICIHFEYIPCIQKKYEKRCKKGLAEIKLFHVTIIALS